MVEGPMLRASAVGVLADSEAWADVSVLVEPVLVEPERADAVFEPEAPVVLYVGPVWVAWVDLWCGMFCGDLFLFARAVEDAAVCCQQNRLSLSLTTQGPSWSSFGFVSVSARLLLSALACNCGSRERTTRAAHHVHHQFGRGKETQPLRFFASLCRAPRMTSLLHVFLRAHLQTP